MSRAIENSLSRSVPLRPSKIVEVPGSGIGGFVDGLEVKIGSRSFAGPEGAVSIEEDRDAARSYVSIGGLPMGSFVVRQQYREGLRSLVHEMGRHLKLALVSGDHQGERTRLESMFPAGTEMQFDRSPFEKRDFVERLQREGQAVLMIGDGLNDAGALRRSNIGIAVTDDVNAFSPACDAILEGNSLHHLPAFLELSRASVRIILVSFGISLLYNIAALSYAVQGTLSPVLAAILMPVSSVTVVALTLGLVRLTARRKGLAG